MRIKVELFEESVSIFKELREKTTKHKNVNLYNTRNHNKVGP